MPGGIVRWRVKQDNSAAWSARLRDRVQTELRASVDRVLADADERCPVRTGELKSTGRVEEISPFSYRVVFGEGLPDARAIYQEFGTAHHPAQPYLGPAFQAEIPTLMGRMAMVTQGRVRVSPGGLGSSPESVMD